MRRLSPSVIAAAGVLVVSGCGQSDADKPAKLTGEKAKVAQVVEDFTTAVSKPDRSKLCITFFTPETIELIKTANGGKSCQNVMTDLIGTAGNRDLVVKSVRIKGDRAETDLVVPFTEGRTRLPLVLRKSGSTWKIDLTELPK